MEFSIDTRGIKDIERDGGVTVEDMQYAMSAEHIANSIGVVSESSGSESSGSEGGNGNGTE